MEKAISVSKIKSNLKTNPFFLSCGLPLGYTAGFPILQIKNDSLCMTVPFLKYQTTGIVDKTRIFPIRYIISLELPTEKAVCFENLEYNPLFKNVNFNEPIGYFRHEEIQQYSKNQYRQLYDELMGEYDKVINALLFDVGYREEDEARMAELLQLLTEPSLLPIYKTLDSNFYNKYLEKG